MVRGKSVILSLLLAASTATDAGTWQLGLLTEYGESPFVGDTQETSVLPAISYIGERFSYQNGKLKFKLGLNGDRYGYLVGQARQRQFYSSDQDINLPGMQDRDGAFEVGIGVNLNASWGQLTIEGLVDATDTHEGYEASIAYGYTKRIGRWVVEPGLRLQFQSSDLADYYHGVTTEESRSDRPAYELGHSVNTITSLMVGYSLSKQVIVVSGVEHIVLDSNISKSPIISEKFNQKIFAGMIYSF